LYYYLKQHPDIDFPARKEPRYFSSIHLSLPQRGPGDKSTDDTLTRSLREYEELYQSISNKWVGDASSEYLYHHEESAHRIKEMLGDVPIFLILRDPVERAYSAYNNLVRDGRETETFARALELEDERISNNYDMMWAYRKVGLYADQVATFLRTFTRVKVFLFEDFVSRTDECLREGCDFLGVDPVQFDTSDRYSISGRPKLGLVSRIFGRSNRVSNSARRLVFAVVPRKYLERVAANLVAKDDMAPEVRRSLREYFRDDVAKLEGLLGRDLGSWE
jgi:hypothetical protein